MKSLISNIKFAIVAGLLFAALGTFAGAVFNDTFISGSYAVEETEEEGESCEHNTCDDLQCAYTKKKRTCRILSTDECATGKC